MRKIIYPTIFLLSFFSSATAQDSILHRIIFIGDAGEINGWQKSTIANAATKVLPGKTSMFYLGDNIYPSGLSLPGNPGEESTREILKSQYLPIRAAGSPVYFIPGNHDWDKSGPEGLAKIKYMGQFLKEQGDSLLQIVPKNGCPDPVEIRLAPNLTVIAFDSEWWLFPYNKNNPNGGCECKTKKDVIAKLQELRYRNRNRIILLACHHPFQTNGEHGGNFTLANHIFPLTAFKKNLFIPLPIIGSIYPVFRSIFSHGEDLKHPAYKELIKQVSAVFKDFPNMAYVAGHEHGLQLIKGNGLQVVSGSGAKLTHVKKKKNALFASDMNGFVTADLYPGNQLRFNFFETGADDTARQKFDYNLAYTPRNTKDTLAEKVITADSVTVSIRPDYDGKGKFHHFLFGKNYRQEWASQVKLPVFHLSQMKGGLQPLQLGGGMQSKSLRLADSSGKEWVLRSVEKVPDGILPLALQETFARDWVDDVTSAQHPFAALSVPPIANAVKVPHSKPIIGVVSPDKNLGDYGRIFDNMVVLFEEREPLGESDNSEKMKEKLQEDNDNTLDGKAFLQARMLDAYLGDWDRHEDQWRWYDTRDGKGKKYTAVPRDRDQVFHVNQGLLPYIATRPGLLPQMRHFDNKMNGIKWLLFRTKFANAYPSFQLTRADWQQQAQKFQAAVTDSVLELALQQLPVPAYNLRHNFLLAQLQSRRVALPKVMDDYYRFTQKIVDVRTSDKNEFVQLSDAPNGGLNLLIKKINKDGEIKDQLMNKTYDASPTKEIRLFLGNGDDSVIIDNKSSNIRLRIVGGKGDKNYQLLASKNKIKLYNRKKNVQYSGDQSRMIKYRSNDSMHTAYSETNLYNNFLTTLSVGINRDDGLIVGFGLDYQKKDGFRRAPYSSRHQLLPAHSFSTRAYRIGYKSEWIDVFRKADITIDALARAPNNTFNFFGRGNATVINKTGDYISFYRTRFSTYQIDPAIRFNKNTASSLCFGPSLYFYALDTDDNAGRIVSNTAAIGSYDSLTVDKSKLHLGFTAQYTNDSRNSKVIPQSGTYFNVRLQAYKGMGSHTRDFAQLLPEFAVYQRLNASATIVLADRMGGTVSIGKTAFYQSAFIGGHENLLGFRQYRFAGQHSFYNNLELRIKVADLANYILPGQLGITAFWDAGRVWENHNNAGTWHHGTGGGIYFAPASLVSFNFLIGHSKEGWLPYFTMGFRF